MQTAPDEKAERRAIQRHLRGPANLGQPASRKVLRPLLAALIVVSEHDAMRSVAHPVQKTRTASRSKIAGLACDEAHPRRGTHRRRRPKTARMNHRRMTFHLASGPNEELDTLYGNIMAELREEAPDRAVAAANVQHRAGRSSGVIESITRNSGAIARLTTSGRLPRPSGTGNTHTISSASLLRWAVEPRPRNSLRHFRTCRLSSKRHRVAKPGMEPAPTDGARRDDITTGPGLL
jgi:hypothetical protein